MPHLSARELLLRVALREQSPLAREDADEGASGNEEGGAEPRDAENSSGRPHVRCQELRGTDRTRSRGQDAANVRCHHDRSSSLENTADWDWEGGDHVRASSPARHRREMKGGAMGNGHARPTPSYALPTKHFKTIRR